MENKKISLGSKALNNAINLKWGPEFLFIFKDKNGNTVSTISLSAFQACIISSKVSKLFAIDPTISQYIFEADGFSNAHIESYFKNVFNGFNKDEYLVYYLKIAKTIETDDIVDDIMEIIKEDTPMESKNVISKIVLKINANVNYDEEIRYAAHNLTKLIQENAFDNCPMENKIDILTSLLSVYQQNENNEKDLEIIFDYIDKLDDEYFIRLVSLLNPKFMNPELISRALFRVNKENITDDFLNFIYKRFDSKKKKVAKNEVNCQYSPSNHLNGIFSELYNRCGKNPCDTDDIRITFSGRSKSSVKDIIEYKGKSNGCIIIAKENEYPKIEFDFGDNKKICLSGYELKVKGETNSYNFPKAWEIKGSNDKFNYEIIDTHINFNEFSAGKVLHFRIPKQVNSYRYIVYQQKENRGSQNQQKFLRLSAIEFYGKIIYH